MQSKGEKTSLSAIFDFSCKRALYFSKGNFRIFLKSWYSYKLIDFFSCRKVSLTSIYKLDLTTRKPFCTLCLCMLLRMRFHVIFICMYIPGERYTPSFKLVGKIRFFFCTSVTVMINLNNLLAKNHAIGCFLFWSEEKLYMRWFQIFWKDFFFSCCKTYIQQLFA